MENMKMNDTLLRQWRMLRDIPRHPRKISTSELVDKLERAGYATTQRTVQRDLIKLSEALPLLADNAKPQGWSWQAGAAQLDLPALEPQAALMFHLAEKYLRPLLPASTVDYLAPWFQTADGVLDSQGNGLSVWRNKVRVLPPGQPLQPPKIDPDVQATVTQALLQEKQIAVTYRPRGDKGDTEYVVNPLGLVVRDHVLYLVCTLWDYDDTKQLVLHRFLKAEALDTPARRLKGFDLDKYIAAGEFGWPAERGKTIKLVAEFDKDAALSFIERPLDVNQKTAEVDDKTVRLTATVMDTRELRTWLLAFGDRVVVLEPVALRQDMLYIANRSAFQYSALKNDYGLFKRI
jgi:predicted DNA-binding transcriptional regulator YafY